jgi:hypothetical protein
MLILLAIGVCVAIYIVWSVFVLPVLRSAFNLSMPLLVTGVIVTIFVSLFSPSTGKKIAKLGWTLVERFIDLLITLVGGQPSGSKKKKKTI